jgi:hypothetical protein
MGREGGCGHLVVAPRLEQTVAPRGFGSFVHDVGVDDHTTKVDSVCWGNAHLREVETEQWSQEVADFPAKRGGNGFGGFEGHPVAWQRGNHSAIIVMYVKE